MKSFFIWLVLLMNVNRCDDLNIACMMPATGGDLDFAVGMRAASVLAVKDINNSSDILPNHRIVIFWHDTKSDAGEAFFQALRVAGISIEETVTQTSPLVVGPTTSGVSVNTELVAREFGLPLISPSATSPLLSNKNDYPTFSRIAPHDGFQGRALAELVQHFGWARVGVLNTLDSYASKLAESFVDAAIERGITVLTHQSFEKGAQDVQTQVAALKTSQATIILLSMLSSDAQIAFREFERQSMIGGHYVYIGVDGWVHVPVHDDPLYHELITGSIGTTPYVDTSTETYQEFFDRWEKLHEEDPSQLFGAANPDTFAAYAYDAWYLAAHAMERFIETNTTCFNNNATETCQRFHADENGYLLNLIRTTSFEGVTGFVELDEFGDRSAAYGIFNFDGQHWISLGFATESVVQIQDPIWAEVPPDKVDPELISCKPGEEKVANVDAITLCFPCGIGRYNTNGNGKCLSCPKGAVCEKDVIAAQKGHWEDIQTRTFYNCWNEACCPSGGCEETVTNPCRSHHIGILCGQCEDGYSKWAGICSSCEDGWSGGLILLIILTSITFTLMCIAIPPSSDAVVKLLIDHFQMCSLFVASGASSQLDTLFQIANLDTDLISSGDCVFPRGPMLKAHSGYILVGLLFSVLLVMFFVYYIAQTFYRKKTVHTVRFINAAWRLAFLSYVVICRTGLQMFHCREVGDVAVMHNEHGVICWDGGHSVAAVFSGIVVTIIAIGLPISMIVMMRRIKAAITESLPPEARHGDEEARAIIDNMRKRSAAPRMMQSLSVGLGIWGIPEPRYKDRGRTAVARKHGQLYLPYRPGVMVWYEALFITRRTIMVVFFVFIGGIVEVQRGVLIGSACMFWILHVHLRPYLRHRLNMFQNVLFGCLISAAVFNIVAEDECDVLPPSIENTFANLVLFMILCPLLYLIPAVWRFYKAHKSTLITTMQSLPSLSSVVSRDKNEDIQTSQHGQVSTIEQMNAMDSARLSVSVHPQQHQTEQISMVKGTEHSQNHPTERSDGTETTYKSDSVSYPPSDPNTSDSVSHKTPTRISIMTSDSDDTERGHIGYVSVVPNIEMAPPSELWVDEQKSSSPMLSGVPMLTAGSQSDLRHRTNSSSGECSAGPQ